MTISIDLPQSLVDSPDCSASMSPAEAALVQTLEGGRAALPVLPTIATQALSLANDPKTSIRQFAQLVKTDPPIAARFLATANSSFYNRGIDIKSVDDAVARIGLSGARDLIFQVVYAASSAGLRRYQDLVQKSFQRSVLCGVLCRVAAPVLSLQLQDAYLCGLLHDIGESRVYRILSESGASCTGEEAARLVSKHHLRAGAELAMRWALPDEIVRVCRKHHEPGKPDNEHLRLVRLADLLAPMVEDSVGPASRRTATELPGGLTELDVTEQQARKILDRGTAAASRL